MKGIFDRDSKDGTEPHELATVAKILREAREKVIPCAPVRDYFSGLSLQPAYNVQDINVTIWTKKYRCVGYKVAFASRLSQREANLPEPVYGTLLSDMAYAEGDEIDHAQFCHPKVETELALVMAQDVTEQDVTYADVCRAIAFVLPAVEIVDPRIKNWDITPIDAVAYNAGAAAFVLGGCPRKLENLDLQNLSASLQIDSEIVSRSGNARFIAHPLSTVLWVARRLAQLGQSLKTGDIIMAGALGPPVDIHPGSRVTATVDGVGTFNFDFESSS